jgi:hypothetical protein
MSHKTRLHGIYVIGTVAGVEAARELGLAGGSKSRQRIPLGGSGRSPRARKPGAGLVLWSEELSGKRGDLLEDQRHPWAELSYDKRYVV